MMDLVFPGETTTFSRFCSVDKMGEPGNYKLMFCRRMSAETNDVHPLGEQKYR
jgi:hypothetical protein